MRQEFLKDRSVIHPFEVDQNPVDKDFNYGRYLSMCMGETLAEVVEVSVTTWVCVGVTASLFFIVMLAIEEDTRLMGWIIAACGWLMVALNRTFESKLVSIRDDFVR